MIYHYVPNQNKSSIENNSNNNCGSSGSGNRSSEVPSACLVLYSVSSNIDKHLVQKADNLNVSTGNQRRKQEGYLGKK